MFKVRTLSKKRTYRLIITLLCISIGLKLTAQITIVGPVCVTANTRYQYVINGNWKSKSTMKVLIKGGTLGPGSSSNLAGPIQSNIFINWNAGVNDQVIVVTDIGTDTLRVRVTNVLSGGQIVDSERVQIYRYDRPSYFIHCTNPTGGACNPYYIYQWQQSNDGIIWKDMPGATGQDLIFSELIKVNRYFRRMTTEAYGNSKTYSNMAQLSIALP